MSEPEAIGFPEDLRFTDSENKATMEVAETGSISMRFDHSNEAFVDDNDPPVNPLGSKDLGLHPVSMTPMPSTSREPDRQTPADPADLYAKVQKSKKNTKPSWIGSQIPSSMDSPNMPPTVHRVWIHLVFYYT